MIKDYELFKDQEFIDDLSYELKGIGAKLILIDKQNLLYKLEVYKELRPQAVLIVKDVMDRWRKKKAKDLFSGVKSILSDIDQG